MLQRENNLEAKVGSFVKGDVKTIEDALKGARDIIAEQVMKTNAPVMPYAISSAGKP